MSEDKKLGKQSLSRGDFSLNRLEEGRESVTMMY